MASIPDNGQIVVTPETMTLVYPDFSGPILRPDTEAMMVQKDGRLLLATKETGQTTFYETSGPFSTAWAQTLRKIGSLSLPGGERVTDGDLSPDGKHFALTTLTHIYEWDYFTQNTP